MSLFKRLSAFFSPELSAIPPISPHVAPQQIPVPVVPLKAVPMVDAQPPTASPFNKEVSEPLPNWISDDDSLRDEGTLFGLSTARPDEKIAAIRTYFGQQTGLLQGQIFELTESVSDLNGTIAQRQTRLDDLKNRMAELRDWQPQPDNLVWTIGSLICLAGLGFGTVYLIDESLRPVFPNHWIAVGVFLAGMLNGLVRASFGSHSKMLSAGWRLMQEGGLPLASAGFVLAQVWSTQPVAQCVALFLFLFFVFWQGGKRLFDTLTQLNQDVMNQAKKRSIAIDRRQNIPIWQLESEQLRREIDAVRTEKRTFTTALNHAETKVAQLNARRDGLVNLFLSEFELARSLRDQLSSQQREAVLTSYKVTNKS